MKTLRLFVYALLTNLLLLYACGNDDSNENISIPEDNKSGITIDSSIISDGLSFSNLQGEQTVSFTTSEDWTLSIASTTSGVSWCTASATSGRKGNTSIKFAVTENTSYDSRIVSVTIKSGAETKTFSISQKCVDALLITTNKYDLSQEGGNINIEVKANIDYTMEISENSKDWINEISNRALSNYKHTFNIAMNENVQKREGEILFKSGDKAETVKVYQSGGAIILLSQNEYLISSQRDTISIDIKSNIDFEVQVPNVDWIHDMTSTRGLSSHTLSYVIDANEQTENRFSQIIFYDKNSDIKDTLKIKQFHSGYLQINTESTGNIPSIINKDSKYKITELIVKGNINGTDIQFLREMSGNDANGNYTDGKLQILDISECNIKEGGNPYIFSKTTKDNFI
ncbi:MAG: BACON domain-containing protein [Bacteroides sp.]